MEQFVILLLLAVIFFIAGVLLASSAAKHFISLRVATRILMFLLSSGCLGLTFYLLCKALG